MSGVAWVRMSSKAPDYASQRSAIEHVAATRGDTIDIWRGDHPGTKTVARQELQRLLLDVRAGRLRGRHLYVFRFDRLARSGIADMLVTLEELRTNGVEVVSAADAFDLNGPHAEGIIDLLTWAAQTERLVRAERTAAQRKRFEAEGGHWGRPLRMGKADVDRARAMRAEGHSIRAMSKALGIPRTTIAQALKRAASLMMVGG